MAWVIDRLNCAPLASLMLVIALGFTIGRVQWRGMSIGPAGGTLGLSILLGGLGLSFAKLYGTETPALTVGVFGFVLFIYSVGFEAGPRFFAVLRSGRGWRFVVVGTMVNLLALSLAVLLGHAFSLGAASTAGLLSGSLTSPPTYAAAAEICDRSGLGVSELAVGFAVTFPMGLVLVVLLIQFLPRFMRDDLKAEARLEEEALGKEALAPVLTRAFKVTKENVTGRSLADLELNHRTGCYVKLVHNRSQVVVPDAQTVLATGDHVLAEGQLEELQAFAECVGPEVYDAELRERMPTPTRVRVLARDAVGRTLSELDLARRFRVLVVGIVRGDVRIETSSDAVLERADLIEVIGSGEGVGELATFVGRQVRPDHRTDIAVYAMGIAIGLALGHIISFPLGGFRFQLGAAGGLLIAGLVMGRFKHLGPFDTNVPPAARQLVRDLGILLFVAETGVKAGGGGLGAYEGMFVPMLGASFVVTLGSVLGAVWFGRRILKMNALDTWGSVGGGMTSSAALVALKRGADSHAPAVSYAAAYAVASVLVTLLGQVVVYLML